MEIAVVYYSAQGNTALAAKALAGKLGAKLVELKEKKPRKLEGGGMMRAAMSAFFGLGSALIGKPWQEVEGCTELHILTPIWAGKPVPAVNAFVRRADFKGRRVALYSVQADPNADSEKGRQALKSVIEARGGQVFAVHGLTGAGIGQAPKEDLAEKIISL